METRVILKLNQGLSPHSHCNKVTHTQSLLSDKRGSQSLERKAMTHKCVGLKACRQLSKKLELILRAVKKYSYQEN